MLVREGNKIVVRRKANEIFGLSKKEKVSKLDPLYWKIEGSMEDTKFSSRNRQVYKDSKLDAPSWKLFKDLVDAINKVNPAGVDVDLESGYDVKDIIESNKQDYKNDSFKELSKVKDLYKEYKGPYLIDKDTGNGRELIYMMGGKVIGHIKVNKKEVDDWVSENLGTKLKDYVKSIMDSVSGKVPLFA